MDSFAKARDGILTSGRGRWLARSTHQIDDSSANRNPPRSASNRVEAALENALDVAADAAVQATYNAWLGGNPDPPGAVWDSSTGPCQIFAATAIDAMNWGRPRGLTDEPERDDEDHADMWSVWSRLHNDLGFNLTACALVLMKCAFDAELDIEDALTYSEADIKAILTNYNGEPSYGERNYGLYETVESFDENARNGL